MDAFLIPGGFGTRQEMHNRRLHEFVQSLPEATLLTSVCTGSWVYGRMGLLDGLRATNRKEPDRLEASGSESADRSPGGNRSGAASAGHAWSTPDESSPLAESRRAGARLSSSAGRIQRDLVAEVARVMEYSGAYELYREDVDRGANERRAISAGAMG